MGVWVIEKRTAYCFLFDELKLNSYERSPFVSIREFIDKKTLEEVVAFEEPNNGQAFSYHFKDHNKTVVAVRLTPEPMMIRVPRKQPDKLVELGRIWAYPAKYLELEKAEVDVLAASLKEAKAKDLTAMHAEAMTDLMASMSTLAADFHAEAAAEAKSVAIPKAVKISEQAEAVAALRAYLEVGNDRGIEAGAIKYMRPTSQWVVSKSPIGLIMHRTADITVGFARTGADDVMPYSECGFVTFEVQQNYDGKGYEKQITATGMATGVKAVPCSRLR